ncbi:RING finger and WD repeat domain-containing protein 3 [Entomortierella beljakovae]|nr:RING finger and WD repeat domain-containing protein 3 [Entomortierella beljakovae]
METIEDLIGDMDYYNDDEIYFGLEEQGEEDWDGEEEGEEEEEQEQDQEDNEEVIHINGAQIENAGTHSQGRQQQLSQDADFQSQNQVVTRARGGPGEVGIPEPRPRNVETEESVCSICFEPWTNSGNHRLASIKCGHLFGESCILKWIAQRSRDGAVKCPECNHPTKRRDVRRLWSKSVVVLDASEKDAAMAKARTEQESRIRCEQELANSRLAFEMLKSEMMKLQRKHDRQRNFKQKYGKF